MAIQLLHVSNQVTPEVPYDTLGLLATGVATNVQYRVRSVLELVRSLFQG